MVHGQLGRTEGWMSAEEVVRIGGVEPAGMAALLEQHGAEYRPFGYPVAEVARQKRVSTATSTRNKSQCIGALEVQCIGGPMHWGSEAEQHETANATQPAQTEGEGGAASGVEGAEKAVAEKICSTQEEESIYLRPKATGPKDTSSSFFGERGSMEVGIVKGRNHGERGRANAEPLLDLLFLTRDYGPVTLDADDLVALRSAHSEQLLRTQLPLAALWLRTNASKRKAAKGLMAFLANWLKRERSAGPANGLYGAATAEKKPRGEWAGVWRVGK